MMSRASAAANGIQRHRFVLCAAAALLTAAAGWRVAGLTLDADLFSLLPRDDPALVATRRAEKLLPESSALVIVLGSAGPAVAASVARDLASLDVFAAVRPLGREPEGGPIIAAVLKTSASDIDASAAAIEAARRVVERHGVAAEFSGTPAVLAEARAEMLRDLSRAGIVALAAVLLFFTLFYRVGWLALVSFLPVGIGIVWGLAAVSFFIDRLTLLAATVPTLLIGVGVDHCIHLVQATNVRIRSGEPRAASIASAWAALLRPLTISALTTAAAFFSLSVARLTGLADMGLAGGAASLGAFAGALLLMPVVLSVCPARWLGRESRMDRWMASLAPLARRRRLLVAAGILVTVAAVIGAGRLTLETDNTRLQNPHLPALVVQERLQANGISTSPIVLTFGSPGDARAFAGALQRTDDAARLIARTDVRPGADGAVLIVHPSGNPFSGPLYRALSGAISAAEEAGVRPAERAGAAVVNDRLTELLRRDWPRVMLAELVTVVVLLSASSGGVRWGLAAMVPLACGVVWTAGLLGLAGGGITIMSAAIAPLILGIGVDDGVHMLHAWRRAEGRFDEVYSRTGTAIVATTVTTVAAFGAFCVSSTPALFQFGWQAVVGLTFCLIGSLVLLPALCGRGKAAQPRDGRL